VPRSAYPEFVQSAPFPHKRLVVAELYPMERIPDMLGRRLMHQTSFCRLGWVWLICTCQASMAGERGDAGAGACVSLNKGA